MELSKAYYEVTVAIEISKVFLEREEEIYAQSLNQLGHIMNLLGHYE
jgi:hypothetical protein